MFIKCYSTDGRFLKAVSVAASDPVQAVALARLECPEGSRFEPVDGSGVDRKKLPDGSPRAWSPVRVIG